MRHHRVRLRKCSFRLVIQAVPGIEVVTVGSSHFHGDIYLELASTWVRKAELRKTVVPKTTMSEEKVANAAIERTLTLRALSRDEFEEL